MDHADRVHPFDPRSADFENAGALSGIISGLYAPFNPLGNAEVRLVELDGMIQKMPKNLVVSQTDGEGFYFFSVPAGTYALSVEKEKYVSFQDTLTIQAGSLEQINIALNGLPYPDKFQLTTTHISQWWPPPLEQFFIEIEAEVDDVDGITDVNRAWLEISALNFADTLIETTSPGRFFKILGEAELPVANLTDLLGQPFTLHVKDQAGHENSSVPQFLVRVIEQTPNPSEPAGLALLTDPNPRLRWEAMQLSYKFTYRVDVVRVQTNIQTVVQTILDIHSDSLSLTVPEALASGEYYWTVSAVDEFGNRSRSREAGFRIE